MKRPFAATLLALAALLSLAYAYHPAPPSSEPPSQIKWLSLEEAYALNQEAPRKIFVDVYTDWCGWCKRMDRDTFSDAEVAAFVEGNYYAVKLNAESDRSFKLGQAEMTERQVARQMGVSGYPTVVFVHEDFRTIEAIPGYQQPTQFLKMLKTFALKKP